MKQLKRYVSIILDLMPSLRRLKDKIIMTVYRLLYIRKSKKNNRGVVELELDPTRVKYLVTEKVNIFNSSGSVQEGNWDITALEIEKSDVYMSLYDHFVLDKSWDECAYFHRVLSQVESGEIKWGCKNKDQVLKRFADIDELYESIQQNGVIAAGNRNSGAKELLDDVLVCIDRRGIYQLYDGRHRLIIALLLGIKNIPVRVIFRHANWDKFCSDVYAYASYHGKLYAPVLHPDLSNVSASHDHQRYRAILDNLDKGATTVLDIGSHWGYFCHRFEMLGYKCTALEPDQKNLYFMKKLREAEQASFDIIENGLFEVNQLSHYDIVLALYIFHHFLKEKRLYELLVAFLGKLDADQLFFASHSPNEPQMRQAYRNYSPEEFAQFILDNTLFNYKKCIWEAEDGRKLYKFW